MTLTTFQQRSYLLFGGFAGRVLKTERLEETLHKARITMRADAYLSYTLAVTILVGIASLFVAVTAHVILLPLLGIGLPAFAVVGVYLSPILFAQIAYMSMVLTPGSKAKARSKDIDRKLPYALNYVSAMASAGVIPTEIFKSLAKQPIYGESAKEAQGIWKDIAVHGYDIITAMRRSIDRSPSVKWQELMQGAITTVTSGGDLQAYFSGKAQRHMWENRQEQKNFLDVMGLMAETYVTAAVAGPLFLIVMISIMSMLQGGGTMTLALIVYMLLPIINFGFVFGIKSMIPEV